MQTQFKCVNKMWELKEKNSFSHLKEIWEQGPTTITIILIKLKILKLQSGMDVGVKFVLDTDFL